MKWINTETSTIRRPEYVGSEPAQRATWWNLLAYCAEQENGGVIRDCASWKCRQWQQTCGVTLEEVTATSDLWQWQDGNLILWNYPTAKESEVSAKREAGRKGGLARSKPQAQLEAEAQAPPQAQLEAVPLEVLQRKEREGEGKEREGEGIAPPSTAPSAPSLPPVASSGRKFPDHGPLMIRVNGLRPEWAKPAAWSGSELHSLDGTLTQFYELTDDDWDLLRRFLSKPLEKAAGYYQPATRSRFVQEFPDVFTSAQRWAGKTNGHRPRTPIPNAEHVGTWK